MDTSENLVLGVQAGAVAVTGTLTVGVDDTGHDVKFFGGTSGRYLLWDESEDSLRFTDNTKIKLGTGNDFQLYHSGSNSFITNLVGDINIINYTDGQDIKFQTDDGNGDVTTYLQIDGGDETVKFFKNIDVSGQGTDILIGDNLGAAFEFKEGSNLYMRFVTTNGSEAIQMEKATTISNSLQVNALTATTGDFSGNVAVEDEIHLTDGGSTVRAKLLLNSSDTDNVELRAESLGSTMKFFTVGTEALLLDASQNATFAGDISAVNLNLTDSGGGNMIILDSSSGDGIIRWEDNNTQKWDIGRDNTDQAFVIANEGGLNDNQVVHINHSTGEFTLKGALTVGVDDTGHDVKFFGATSGSSFLYDQASDQVTVTHPTGVTGIEAYTISGGVPTVPQIKIGRSSAQYWGVFTGDRDANVVHRQDETSGQMKTNFQQWDNNTSDTTGIWQWQHGDASGGSLTQVMQLSQAGVLTVATLDIGGNVDIDGTTNLDEVDIDGAVQIDNTLTVGVDDTGYDVKFFGATSGKFMLWDESQDSLELTDDVILKIGDDGDLAIEHDGSHSYIRTSNSSTGNLIITQNSDGADIVFKCDDGSGGITSYLTLDGSATRTIANQNLQMADGKALYVGASSDAGFYHLSGHNYIENNTGDLIIVQNADDKDIIFQCDDGSNGVETYFFLDGNAGGANPTTIFPDESRLAIGSGQDLKLYHTPSTSHIDISNGNLKFRQITDDGDIIFQCDDGSGGLTNYITIDGSATNIKVAKDMRFTDSVDAEFGTGGDFKIYHDGSNTYLDQINSGVGNIVIQNQNDDADIIFKSDDGSGGVAEYFRLDGGEVETRFSKATLHFDNVWAKFGNGGDLRIYHDGSNSYIEDAGTGNLSVLTNSFRLLNAAANENMIQATENGAVTLYYNNNDKLETKTNGVNVKYSITGNTDGTHAGDVVHLGESETVAGKIYYYTAAGAWEPVDADAEATCKGLLAVALGSSSSTNGMLLRGMVTLDHDPGTVGDTLFASTQAGSATSTAPSGAGDIVRVIGYCLNSSNGQIWFNPDGAFVEVAAS
jgi:hypothetical protein